MGNEIKKALSIEGNHACRRSPADMCPVSSAVPMPHDHANGKAEETAQEQDRPFSLIFVTNKKFPSCPHYVPFADDGFCNSPVRKDIYKKFKK